MVNISPDESDCSSPSSDQENRPPNTGNVREPRSLFEVANNALEGRRSIPAGPYSAYADRSVIIGNGGGDPSAEGTNGVLYFPGEWHRFDVHYVGTGISSHGATQHDGSDSSFVSDTDDDQYDGYEPLAIQPFPDDDEPSTSSDDEYVVDGPAISAMTSVEFGDDRDLGEVRPPRIMLSDVLTRLKAELTANPIRPDSQDQTSLTDNPGVEKPKAESDESKAEAGKPSGSRNNIPLDDAICSQITTAMAGFTLPPHPDMPDDNKILEMVKKISNK